MKYRDFLEKWGLASLRIKLGFLEGEFQPQDPDRAAAWDLYVELLTRVTTQNLLPDEGDEKTALESVFSLFPLTREILKKHGTGAQSFAKLAIPVLNQVIRPFTAKWHKRLQEAKDASSNCEEFRYDLDKLQSTLRKYTASLAALAQVEDLTFLELSDANSR